MCSSILYIYISIAVWQLNWCAKQQDSGELVFEFSQTGDKPSWLLRFGIDWRLVNAARADKLAIERWSVDTKGDCITYHKPSSKLLKFPKIEAGAKADYTSNSEYLVVVTSLSDHKKSWNEKGEFDFGTTVEASGYHEMKAEFHIYYNKANKYQFVATEIADNHVIRIKPNSDMALAGTGAVTFKIATASSGSIHYKANLELGATQLTCKGAIGINLQKQGMLEPIEKMPLKWHFVSRQMKKI